MPNDSANPQYPCPKCGSKMVRNGHTPGGKVRWVCFGEERNATTRKICYTTVDPSDGRVRTQSGRAVSSNANLRFFRPLGKARKFVVTSAQNATPVHEGFLKALECYCNENSAELIVIPIRYKNPTSRWAASQRNEEWWTEAVQPYLYNQRKKLNENLVLLGDIKTRPTAERPLTGFEGITHGESGILGHSRLQMVSIPTPAHRLPKIMTTTGSVTVKNYTDSKAGKKGEFHHTFGACVVECVGTKKFHMRQLKACRDGSFIDWRREYLPTGKSRAAPRAKAIIYGDTHYRFLDPGVAKATWGSGGLVETLDPEWQVFHDLLDGYFRNPHHRENVFTEIAKRSESLHLGEREVRETVEFLSSVATKRNRACVVPSNHDRFLSRWIADTDWRRDPDNAEFYLRTALAMVRSVAFNKASGAEVIDPFTYWVGRIADNPNIKCLDIDESFKLGNYECGFHGDRGPNGARGTVMNLSKLGTRVISGHGHSPAIEGGHIRVGTSTALRQEYTMGPSSWLNTHAVVHANDKATLINIIDGDCGL